MSEKTGHADRMVNAAKFLAALRAKRRGSLDAKTVEAEYDAMMKAAAAAQAAAPAASSGTLGQGVASGRRAFNMPGDSDAWSAAGSSDGAESDASDEPPAPARPIGKHFCGDSISKWGPGAVQPAPRLSGAAATAAATAPAAPDSTAAPPSPTTPNPRESRSAQAVLHEVFEPYLRPLEAVPAATQLAEAFNACARDVDGGPGAAEGLKVKALDGPGASALLRRLRPEIGLTTGEVLSARALLGLNARAAITFEEFLHAVHMHAAPGPPNLNGTGAAAAAPVSPTPASTPLSRADRSRPQPVWDAGPPQSVIPSQEESVNPVPAPEVHQAAAAKIMIRRRSLVAADHHEDSALTPRSRVARAAGLRLAAAHAPPSRLAILRPRPTSAAAAEVGSAAPRLTLWGSPASTPRGAQAFHATHTALGPGSVARGRRSSTTINSRFNASANAGLAVITSGATISPSPFNPAPRPAGRCQLQGTTRTLDSESPPGPAKDRITSPVGPSRAAERLPIASCTGIGRRRKSQTGAGAGRRGSDGKEFAASLAAAAQLGLHVRPLGTAGAGGLNFALSPKDTATAGFILVARADLEALAARVSVLEAMAEASGMGLAARDATAAIAAATKA